MKQVHPSYSFNAATKTITLTGLNIDQDQLLLIVNATRGVQYFNFADSSLRGVVTSGANTSVVLTDASTTGHANGDSLAIYYEDQLTGNVVSGTVTANPGTGAFTVSGTVGLDAASLVALENITVTVGAAVTISNFPASQTIAGTVTANVTNSVTVGAILSPIGQNVLQNSGIGAVLKVKDNAGTYGELQGSGTLVYNLPVYGTVTVGNSVTIGSLPAISGTVTANVDFAGVNGTTPPSQVVPIGYIDTVNTGNLVHVGNDGSEGLPSAIRNIYVNGVGYTDLPVWLDGSAGYNVPISGTVTIGAMPNGALTTRFGTPTTASSVFATSAVTNTSRKYLLIQNVTTQSNVITVGIGFTPTTTQGIQLTAGAGITFESSYIPTGAVYVLSSVTASNFTILEA